LKTYGLVCEACLPAWFRRARDRHAACRKASGEALDLPGIYRVERERRDQQLERLIDMECDLTNR
jgi:hypothetical protein